MASVRHEKPVRKAAKGQGSMKAASPGIKTGDFVLIDTQQDTCQVVGVDAQGNQVDISSLASLAVTSSDPTVLTVDPPAGMGFTFHTTGKVGKCALTIIATWNDGSQGPYSIDFPIDVQAGGPTGIMVVPGTPTINVPPAPTPPPA